ncbi:C40 family peptidase [Aeromicrobium sp. Leaf350]|uniref:C40 family peptidase n=1 Tax=Aeromicrobium sp. Leaf350 TaxID=2876565 RepID=UPI001E47DEA2|nr:C40 family peptidase [Aeromicrobium sp. Leaf350]
MASTHHPARNTPRRLLVALTAIVLGAGLVGGTAQAEPDRADAVAQVEQAFNTAAAVNEEVNQLTSDIQAAEASIAALDTEIATIQSTYDEQRAALGAVIVQQQIDTPLGATASLLGSDDPETFLEGLSAVQAFNSTQVEALESFSATSADLQSRQSQLQQLKAQLDADKADADAKQAEVQNAYDAAQSQLAALDEAQRAQFDTANNASIPANPAAAPSGFSGSAIDFALSRIGTPYRYGGNGPDSYDCSGLTKASFAAAGVSLPRTARTQYGASQQISMSDIQPGDLVFYGDMSHVAIYLGNGQVVEAPSSGSSVRVASLRSNFTKAGRVG